MRSIIVPLVLAVGCSRSPAPQAPRHHNAAAPVATLADPLALLPANSDLVIKIDVGAMRRARTMVMQGSKGPTKASLQHALTIGAPLRNDPAYLAAERALPRDAALTALARPGAAAFLATVEQRVGAPVQGLTLSIELTDVVKLRAAIELRDPATAAALADNAQPTLSAIKPYVARYDIRAEGATVVGTMEATEAQIKMFVDLARSAMPTGDEPRTDP